MQRCSICTLMLTGDVLARAADVWHVLAHEHNHAHTLAERRDNSLDSTLVVARAAALYDLSRKSLLYPGMSNCERLATSSKMAPNSFWGRFWALLGPARLVLARWRLPKIRKNV